MTEETRKRINKIKMVYSVDQAYNGYIENRAGSISGTELRETDKEIEGMFWDRNSNKLVTVQGKQTDIDKSSILSIKEVQGYVIINIASGRIKREMKVFDSERNEIDLHREPEEIRAVCPITWISNGKFEKKLYVIYRKKNKGMLGRPYDIGVILENDGTEREVQFELDGQDVMSIAGARYGEPIVNIKVIKDKKNEWVFTEFEYLNMYKSEKERFICLEEVFWKEPLTNWEMMSRVNNEADTYYRCDEDNGSEVCVMDKFRIFKVYYKEDKTKRANELKLRVVGFKEFEEKTEEYKEIQQEILRGAYVKI